MCEKVAHLADRSLHVADDRPVGIIEKFHTDLRHITSVTGTAENLIHLGELDGLVLVKKRRNGK